MGKLLRLARPYWALVLLSPLLMLLEVATELMQPRLMAQIIDRGIARGDLDFIWRTGGLMLLLASCGMLLGLGMIVTSSIASQRYGAELRELVFAKVMHLPTASLDQFGAGSLLTRLTNDVTQMQRLIMIMMRMLIRAPMLAVGSLIMAISINCRLSLLLLGTVPVLFVIITVIQAKGVPLFRRVQQKLDRVNTVLQENLAGMRVIRALSRREYETERFENENAALRDSGILSGRVMGMLDPLMRLGMHLTIVLVVWIGGRMINTTLPSGEPAFAVGQMMAYISYLTQLMFALVRNSVLINALAQSKASAERINQVLDLEPGFIQPAEPVAFNIAAGRVEFRGVSFRYPTATGDPVLQQVSFVAEPGQTVAIIGATGSGKSTLVSLIPRLYDVLEGEVLIDGVDVRTYQLAGLRAGIGMVMQDTTLFSGAVADNLRWGRLDSDEAQLQVAASAAQADQFISRLPQGYRSLIGQRGSSLSGGQKQRISIARALVRRPKILILDDATSAVDMGTEARIQQALRQRDWPCTVFIVAQRVSTVMDADQIIVLDNGRVTGIGTHQQLLQENPVYREIVQSQLGQEVV